MDMMHYNLHKTRLCSKNNNNIYNSDERDDADDDENKKNIQQSQNCRTFFIRWKEIVTTRTSVHVITEQFYITYNDSESTKTSNI